MSADAPFGDDATARTARDMGHEPRSLAPSSDRPRPRRDIINRWSAALARRDDDEVDRLVQQSRIDRAWFLASEQLARLPNRLRDGNSAT
jgi:hypothetical protein